MNIRETISQLEELIRDRESFMVGDYDKDIYDRDKEALEEGIRALEKQLPKKPLGGVDIDGNEYRICHVCCAIVEDVEWKAAYCPDCGQKQDWSEFE